MEENIKELTLLLLYLTSWEEEGYKDQKLKRSWKTFRYEVLDELNEEGLLSGSKKAKSVYFTEKGEKKAEKLKKKYLED
ncbi:MAG: transposase [Candidatus Mcinerneyibacterium aminivorans]|uniref:Transposase n=1 Tax=Candidatus Mcinerneyibacterium aminivorans TaxID=2703815 RepID=A0A5D0MAB9_9BACT|nr:MAG: transposase [Candidatus Mcinerneyibacterium aminivorans]